MTRLTRRTAVVLVVALLSCLAGMSIAVVAFGQSDTNPDATVPAGDFTGTTPASSPSTTPVVTTPVVTATTPAPTTDGPSTSPSTTTTSRPPSSSSHRHVAARPHGAVSSSTAAAVARASAVPARATRPGPTHLAFTGGEPLLVGAGGLGLMLAGLGLQRRRSPRRLS